MIKVWLITNNDNKYWGTRLTVCFFWAQFSILNILSPYPGIIPHPATFIIICFNFWYTYCRSKHITKAIIIKNQCVIVRNYHSHQLCLAKHEWKIYFPISESNDDTYITTLTHYSLSCFFKPYIHHPPLSPQQKALLLWPVYTSLKTKLDTHIISHNFIIS